MIVKTTVLQGLTAPLSKAMNRRSAVAQEQVRQEGQTQRQESRQQESRKKAFEKSPQGQFLSAREQGEKDAAEAGPFE